MTVERPTPLPICPQNAEFIRRTHGLLIGGKWVPADSGRYAFQHMLVQEAAFQSLVRSRRQHYHRLIAHALEEHFPEVVAAEPEILAHHYAEANLGWQAIPYLQKADARAASQSSHALALRAATSLVRMELGLSNPPTSRKMLQDILAHFAEGADTPDLQSAREVLANPATG